MNRTKPRTQRVTISSINRAVIFPSVVVIITQVVVRIVITKVTIIVVPIVITTSMIIIINQSISEETLVVVGMGSDNFKLDKFKENFVSSNRTQLCKFQPI